MIDNTFIEMFSGIGGFRLGLEKAGWSCVWANDNDKYANTVYKRHFGSDVLVEGDIRNIDAKSIPSHTLLTAGFPCQSFSLAGQRKGFQDNRGQLFWEVARVAKAKRPLLLFLENVRGLLSTARGTCFASVLQALDDMGYFLEWQVLNSKYFGVPQNRQRVFIVGHLGEGCKRQIFPVGETNPVSTQDAGNGKGIASCCDANYHKGARRQRTFVIAQSLQTDGMLYQGSSWGTSNPQSSRAIRRLTPIECERLQGFPDGWTEGISDTQRYKVLGNAVTVNVVKFLSERLLEAINNGTP